jgi:hypothetical protein
LNTPSTSRFAATPSVTARRRARESVRRSIHTATAWLARRGQQHQRELPAPPAVEEQLRAQSGLSDPWPETVSQWMAKTMAKNRAKIDVGKSMAEESDNPVAVPSAPRGAPQETCGCVTFTTEGILNFKLAMLPQQNAEIQKNVIGPSPGGVRFHFVASPQEFRSQESEFRIDFQQLTHDLASPCRVSEMVTHKFSVNTA